MNYINNGEQIFYTESDLLKYNFIEKIVDIPFKFFKLGTKYSIKSLNNGKSSLANSWIRNKFYHDLGGLKWIIIVPRHLGSRTPIKFKLLFGEPEKLALTGEWRYFIIDDESEARRIAEYLNTDQALQLLKKIARVVVTDGNKKDDWIIKIDKRKFEEMPIPNK